MPFFGGGIGAPELLIFGTIALLLFGKRLPEVARSLGQGVGQFKKGLSGLQEEFNKASEPPPKKKPEPAAIAATADDDREEWSAPAFSPPPAEAATEKQPEHV
ncbi:Sec-independent protein translocase subunit TatA/TatB [Alienimonas californiensis]|uniref:Sec-independent protein translocase protein TatA n=1 Tax=Alienimonas californiensis TaxID=2527989 RepID=A0A517P9G5_9PLAN|nr:twin-arginine translocase TatA/TatE family subunit [Alienimonas californiensis]QDT16011.1 twin arginine translocase protein A [Alienimonas californiensis]